jgi:TPR repeat protein
MLNTQLVVIFFQGLADKDNAKAGIDNTEAVKRFIKSAKQGNIGAQNALGNAYYYGTGVPQDYSLAFEWFQK